MKRILSLFLAMAILFACSITISAAAIGGSTNNPLLPHEIQSGTILGFDSVDGDFGTRIYYLKILCEDEKEYIYALADRVYYEDSLYNAEDVIEELQSGDRYITFAVRSEKIKYINPYMPDGLFEGVEIEVCYRSYDKIITHISFENIVGKCTCIVAAYNSEGSMCSVTSFEASYLDSYYEIEMDGNGGECIKVFFLQSTQSLKPVCEAKVGYIATEYAYLLSVTNTESGHEFEILTTSGEVKKYAAAEEIVIDESDLTEDSDSVSYLLESSAKRANGAYEDEVNADYCQPIMYKLNEKGEIARIDTTTSSVNPEISALVNNKAGYATYGYRQFESAEKSFGDFKINDDTVVFFAPDDRSDKDEYIAYKGYKNTFLGTKSYHVEAYGLSEDKIASLVIMYKDNGKNVYTYSSPMLIVASKVKQSNGELYITGYTGTSYSIKHVYVDEEEIESLDAIGKGDIIRYITNSSSEMIDYQVWYDADNALQQMPCDSIDSAIKNRILEVKATSIEPVVNYPNAAFRLQYGTVCDIELDDEGDRICVTPTIADDGIDMVAEGNGVVEWEIDSSLKVFEYDGENVLTEADLTDIVEGKTEVVAYSSSGKLRALYIINPPYVYVSSKKIMTVEKVTEKVTGYEISGYSEGEKVVFDVDVNKEPVVDDIVKGNIIAYTPDGDTIGDIELVFSATTTEFLPEDGEGLIAQNTLERVVFGLVDYGTDSVTVNGVQYSVTNDTNYLLMKYGSGTIYYGIGKYTEMKKQYVLIRVKAEKPTEIADVVIFQGLN